MNLKSLPSERNEDLGRAGVGPGSSLASDEGGENREVAIKKTKLTEVFSLEKCESKNISH